MTKSQWRKSVDIAAMLRVAGVGMSPRKRRLFACACCRRLDFMIDHAFEGRREDYRNALATSEQFADGLATEDAMLRASDNADDSWFINFDIAYDEDEGSPGDPFRDVASTDLEEIDDIWRRLLMFVEACGLVRTTDGMSLRTGPQGGHDAEVEAERKVQADMLRDIAGEPGRPAFDPAWRSADATNLAHAIYEDRAFDRLPILADALEEAGCDDSEILDHCRKPGTHVRGCWVVDLVLGKE